MSISDNEYLSDYSYIDPSGYMSDGDVLKVHVVVVVVFVVVLFCFFSLSLSLSLLTTIS